MSSISALRFSMQTGICSHAESTISRTPADIHNFELMNNVPYNLPRDNKQQNKDILQEKYGISQSVPKYKQFVIKHMRELSFEHFPSHITQTPKELAEAGFFYSGEGDVVFCYHCGQGLKSWDPTDDVWVEHARWAPHCVHLLNCKGREFVKMIQDGHQEIKQVDGLQENKSPSKPKSPASTSNEKKHAKKNNLNILLRTVAAESLIQNGYSKELVGKSIRIFLKKEGSEDFNSTDLMKILLQLEEGEIKYEDIITDVSDDSGCELQDGPTINEQTEDEQTQAQSLLEENRQLKEKTLCKICLDENVSMVFLPCGHLCCCSQCAPALRKCPICREYVKGTVKTYLN